MYMITVLCMCLCLYVYPPLCSGALSQTADTTVKVWSVILPQLLSLAVRLGVAV
jgi:hypothetical protein